MYYAIYDKQIGDYLHSGCNCTTKKECVEEGISFLLNGDDYTEHYSDEPTVENMQNALENEELIIDESGEKFPESDLD